MRLELFVLAKEGLWEKVLGLLSLPSYLEMLNELEPDSPGLNTLLHYAALTHANPDQVRQLIEMRAWRTRRSAANQTPLEIAREQGHASLYDILEPVFKRKVAPETLHQIEHHFHDVIRQHRDAGPLVLGQSLQLPQLGPLLEFDSDSFYFPVPGLYGGFSYRFRDHENELVLFATNWCRIVGGSEELRKITTSGSELLAVGEKVFELELKYKILN